MKIEDLNDNKLYTYVEDKGSTRWVTDSGVALKERWVLNNQWPTEGCIATREAIEESIKEGMSVLPYGDDLVGLLAAHATGLNPHVESEINAVKETVIKGLVVQEYWHRGEYGRLNFVIPVAIGKYVTFECLPLIYQVIYKWLVDAGYVRVSISNDPAGGVAHLVNFTIPARRNDG